MSEHVFDVIIVGGGPVGCAAALALAGTGANVAVLEAQENIARAPDSRTLALSWNSKLIVERLGAWARIASATAIETIHVSHRGRFGRAELRCGDVGLPALGYVVRFSHMWEALLDRAITCGIEFRSGFRVTDINTSGTLRHVSGSAKNGDETLVSRLVLMADGGASLAKFCTAKVRVHDYSQHAVVGLVRTDLPHQQRAFERFTPEGPIALLPCEQEYAFVWTCSPEDASQRLVLGDKDFLAKLQTSFGDRAGKFIGARLRSAFPLQLRIAREADLRGVVFLGNAAQTLHPIAGQGFNLGLRDAWDFAEAVRRAPAHDVAHPSVTELYRRQRAADRFGTISITDGLARVFSNNVTPFAIGRGVGLAVLDAIPPLKRVLMRQMIFGTGT